MKKLVLLIYRILLILSMVLYLVAALALPFLYYPIRMFSKPKAMYVSTFYAYWAWSVLSCIFRITTPLSFPRKLVRSENYFVISNHTSSVDFMVMNELAIANGMLSSLKYMIKEAAVYIPIFGIGMKMIGFLFIRRKISEDRSRILEYCDFMKKNKVPMWFILFPEGTRFSEDKAAKSREFCRRRRFPELRNVLFPKTTGFKILAENFRNSHIKYIADVTIFFNAEKHGVPTLLDVLVGTAWGSYKVDIEITPLEQISDLEGFLVESFIKKDQKIERWKQRALRKKGLDKATWGAGRQY